MWKKWYRMIFGEGIDRPLINGCSIILGLLVTISVISVMIFFSKWGQSRLDQAHKVRPSSSDKWLSWMSRLSGGVHPGNSDDRWLNIVNGNPDKGILGTYMFCEHLNPQYRRLKRPDEEDVVNPEILTVVNGDCAWFTYLEGGINLNNFGKCAPFPNTSVPTYSSRYGCTELAKFDKKVLDEKEEAYYFIIPDAEMIPGSVYAIEVSRWGGGPPVRIPFFQVQ